MARKQKSFLESYQSYKNKKNRGKPETLAKREQESSLKYTSKPENQDKVKQYHSARKEMGLSQDDTLTKKKYDSMFGNAKTGDKGTFGRFQEYNTKQNKPTPSKGVGSSFDKKVDKGLGLLAKGFKKGVNEVKELADNNLFKKLTPGKKTVKTIYSNSPLKGKVETAKLALKGLDKADQYTGASSARNVLENATDDKNQSAKEYIKDIKKGFTGERRATGEEISKNLGLTNSKYGNKVIGLGIEMVADPTNLLGAGAYKLGSKAFKNGSKLGKETPQDLIKQINDKGKITPSDAKKIIQTIKDPKQIKALEEVSNPKVSNMPKSEPTVQQVIGRLPKREQNLKNIKLPQGKIEVRPTVKKSLTDLMNKGKVTNPKKPVEIKQKLFDYDGEKQQLEFIRQADRENFIKNNQAEIDVVRGIRESEYRKQMEQEIEFEGHQKMAEDYKRIRNSLAKNRLNIPEGNHADFATQLSKGLYSAKGKGTGDDIYKVADDLGFKTVDDFLQYYNNTFESHNIVKGGKGKFITQKVSGDPDGVIDELYGQTESARNFQKSFDDLELRKSQIPVGDDYINQLLSGNAKQSKATREEVLHADPQPLDPTTAPLSRAPKHYVIPKRIEGPQTPVNQAYAPEVGDGQRINFETGQVEDVPLTNVEKTKQRSEKIVSELGQEWKNRSKFKIYRETQDRNFDKIFGEDSRLMKDTYLEPIKQDEATRIKEIKSLKKDMDNLYKTHKISKKDDALIQEFGEGKISLDELKKRTSNWANVQKAVEPYKKLYKEVIVRMNKELVENGFDPIPELDNYFPHYNDEGGVLKDIFGIDKTNNNLPTDINGLTDQFRPQKSFFGNALKRTGDKTSFGALQGLSQYIEGASTIIHHTKNIRNIRSLEDAIRTQFAGTEHLNDVAAYLKEYGDSLAGKKGKLDRGAEELLGRGAYNMAKTLQGNIGKAMTSYNVGSALTGFIPSIFGAAQTSKVALGKALFETMQNTIKNDGFIDSSPFLTRRFGADPLYMTKWDKVSDKGYWLMKQVDNFNAQLIVRGKYNELISQKGKDGKPLYNHDEAIKMADNWGAKVLADRSKGQTPLLFNQKTLGPITQFQIEVNNQLSHVLKDMPEEIKRKSKSKGGVAFRTAAAYGQLAIYGYLFNELYENVTGRRPALDPIDYAMKFKDSLNGDAKATELVKSVAGQLPFTSPFVQGRTPLDAAVPNIAETLEEAQFMGDGSYGDITKNGLKQATKLPYLFMPGYSQFNKTKDSYKALNEDTPGLYTDSGKLKYLVDGDTPNKLKGLIFGKGAFRETKEYYDNDRKPLSEKQTQTVLNSSDPKSAYKQIHIKKLDDKLKRLQKQPIKENEEKMKKLMEQLKKMKGE